MAERRPGRPSMTDTEAERVISDLRKLFVDRFHSNKTRLGKAVGRSQPAMTHLLAGISKPSIETAKRIASLMGKRFTDYLDETARHWVLETKFPSKAIAADAARNVEYSDDAIEMMLREESSELKHDPGPKYWLKRVDLYESMNPAPGSSGPPSPAVIRSNGSRKRRAGSGSR